MEIKVKLYARDITERLQNEPVYRTDIFVQDRTVFTDYHAVADTPQKALRLAADLWEWSEKPVSEREPRKW